MMSDGEKVAKNEEWEQITVLDVIQRAIRAVSERGLKNDLRKVARLVKMHRVLLLNWKRRTYSLASGVGAAVIRLERKKEGKGEGKGEGEPDLLPNPPWPIRRMRKVRKPKGDLVGEEGQEGREGGPVVDRKERG